MGASPAQPDDQALAGAGWAARADIPKLNPADWATGRALALPSGQARYDRAYMVIRNGAAPGIGIDGTVPNAFDWLIPERLAACVNPCVGRQAADRLQAVGIRRIINLYERADEPELLERLGAREVHLPVPGSCAPTQEQLEVGVRAITEALGQGAPVAVHCGAGLGRAGTMLAAYLVSQGGTADEAMARVRAARPGSIETVEQEQAVRDFASSRLTAKHPGH